MKILDILLHPLRSLRSLGDSLRDIHLAVNQLGTSIGELQREHSQLGTSTHQLKILAGKCLVQQMRCSGACTSVHDAEFKVFSQFGDDGIIQYLVDSVPIDCDRFVEFGVENYTESNTRFLLVNKNWSGLVIDGDKNNIEYVRQDDMFWRHDLKGVHAFLNRQNINRIIRKAGFAGEVGVLSIDIDGNDYWIWEHISVVDPMLVIVEYNSIFGCTEAVTIPYTASFRRTEAHFSNLYWGASLKALCKLGNEKGYAFVGSNSAGNNAYFLRRDKAKNIREVSSEDGYVKSKFRESRDEDGNLTYLSHEDALRVIAELPLFDLNARMTVKIKDLFLIR